VNCCLLQNGYVTLCFLSLFNLANTFELDGLADHVLQRMKLGTVQQKNLWLLVRNSLS
jgi:hypothetical protein